MIPAGYMYKHVAWTSRIVPCSKIYSVSGCIAPVFCSEYISHWRHNGWWFYDDPDTARAVARVEGAELIGLTLFYYEYYPQEFDEDLDRWGPLATPDPEPGIRVPAQPRLEGFDVVTFSQGNAPECSPITCNDLWRTIPVNERALFRSVEEARAALDRGLFDDSEPGPFRIIAVYTCDAIGEAELAQPRRV